jgi:hypothetical protein
MLKWLAQAADRIFLSTEGLAACPLKSLWSAHERRLPLYPVPVMWLETYDAARAV